jgi:hypothetical protein
LVYREFDPLPTLRDGRVVQDPDAKPYRQIISFGHRSEDPAASAGERLKRSRGLPVRELHGLTGGGAPAIGKDLREVQTTPHRIPVPPDLMRQAAILRDSPPAGTVPKPSSAPDANVNQATQSRRSQSQER